MGSSLRGVGRERDPIPSYPRSGIGDRQVRVRGHSKVLCLLMFGILALTVDQLLLFVN